MGKKKNISAAHAAPGPAAGYLFQPEQALAYLASMPSGARIGIETDDDIAVSVNGATVVRAQLKHTTSKYVPFSDRGIDLWKTLLLWIDAAAAKEFDVDNCYLLPTTNANLGNCFLTQIEACKGGPRKIAACVKTLLTPATPYATDIQKYADRVKKHDPKLVCRMMSKIRVVDGSNSHGPALRKKIASDLHIPSNVSQDDIINGLLGWVHSTALELWRKGEPAWLERNACDNLLHRLIRKLRVYQRLGRPAHLIAVPLNVRLQQLGRMYVKQLRLIDAAANEVSTATDDFIRCSIERFRLASEGDLTKDDWIDFDLRLAQQWQAITNRETRGPVTRDPKDIGYAIYSGAIEFEPHLGLDAPQPYIARGSFHRLSNALKIGWHPEYRKLCST